MQCQSVPLFLCPSLARRPVSVPQHVIKSSLVRKAFLTKRAGDAFSEFEKTDKSAPKTLWRRRFLVKSQAAADAIVDSWNLQHRQHPLTILDCMAAEGNLSRSFTRLKNLKRLYSLEPESRYRQTWLSKPPVQHKLLEFVPADCASFLTWSAFEKLGFLSGVRTRPWNEDSDLFLAMVLPDNIYSEKLIFSVLQCVPSKRWLYKYGKVEMGCVASEQFANKLMLPIGDRRFHKSALILRMVCDIEETYVPSASEVGFATQRNKSRTLAFKIIPKERTLLDENELDMLQFIARTLFTTKSTPLRKCIKAIAPNAESLLQKLADKGQTIDDNKKPFELSLDEWVRLTREFARWPFRPTHIFDDPTEEGEFE